MKAMAGGLGDSTDALFDVLRKRREKEELDAELEERKQTIKTLDQRIEEIEKKVQEVHDLYSSYDMFLKDQDDEKAAEKAERVRQEALQEEAEIRRLEDKYAALTAREQELQREVERHAHYRHFMEQVLKMTKFEDVEQLAGHLENLLHFRDKLYKRVNEAQEQANQQRKALLTLEDQHRLVRLQKNNQLSQLQTELEEARSEARIWERKWNHIQETAAAKTLLLGQIKMATLNLYEMTTDRVKEEERVDINDTEKQLEMIKMFMQDHEDIVKQYQTISHRHKDGQKRSDQKRNKAKRHIATHSKKK